MRESEDLPDALLEALGDEMLRIRRRGFAAVEGTLLGASAFRILRMLDKLGPRTLRQLADDLHLDQSTITRQVNAAIKLGLLERVDDGAGTRRVRATPAGDEAYRHDGELHAQRFRTALRNLGAERAHALVAEMQAFNDALDGLEDME